MHSFETFTDDNWATQVLGSPTPVIVDFWAEWCQPCHALVPVLEQVKQHFGERIRIGKMNVEENNSVPFQYNINRLPTLLVLKGGQVSEQRIGLLSKDELIKVLTPHLG
jgi:thioredoxin 1